MKVSVVGYGSAGQRHTNVLRELGCEVSVVTARPTDFPSRYTDVETALQKVSPDYVVIANRPHEHERTLESLVSGQFQGRVLVEKPIFQRVTKLPAHDFSTAVVGYNLRCHPLLEKLKQLVMRSRKTLTASIYVGSFLPAWRPTRDYRQTYSSRTVEGGGVLRDLSHELDYAQWLFGRWTRITALGGHFSELEIDAADAYTLLMETERCSSVTIHMNYFDRNPRRELVVNTEHGTIAVDLINNVMVANGEEETVSLQSDDTYRAEHRAVMMGKDAELCSFEEGVQTLVTIEAAERAAVSHSWIER